MCGGEGGEGGGGGGGGGGGEGERMWLCELPFRRLHKNCIVCL